MDARGPPYGHIKEEEIQPVCIAYETILCYQSGPHPNTTTETIAKATHSTSLEKATSKYMA